MIWFFGAVFAGGEVKGGIKDTRLTHWSIAQQVVIFGLG